MQDEIFFRFFQFGIYRILCVLEILHIVEIGRVGNPKQVIEILAGGIGHATADSYFYFFDFIE